MFRCWYQPQIVIVGKKSHQHWWCFAKFLNFAIFWQILAYITIAIWAVEKHILMTHWFPLGSGYCGNPNKGLTIIVDHCLYAGVGACRLQVYWGRSAEVSCPSTMPSTWTRRGRLRKFDDVGGEGPPAPAGKITGKEVVRSEGTIFSSAVEAGQPPSPKIGSGKSSE